MALNTVFMACACTFARARTCKCMVPMWGSLGSPNDSDIAHGTGNHGTGDLSQCSSSASGLLPCCGLPTGGPCAAAALLLGGAGAGRRGHCGCAGRSGGSSHLQRAQWPGALPRGRRAVRGRLCGQHGAAGGHWRRARSDYHCRQRRWRVRRGRRAGGAVLPPARHLPGRRWRAHCGGHGELQGSEAVAGRRHEPAGRQWLGAG